MKKDELFLAVLLSDARSLKATAHLLFVLSTYLFQGAALTEEDKSELMAMLCPWKTHSSMDGAHMNATTAKLPVA